MVGGKRERETERERMMERDDEQRGYWEEEGEGRRENGTGKVASSYFPLSNSLKIATYPFLKFPKWPFYLSFTACTFFLP